MIPALRVEKRINGASFRVGIPSEHRKSLERLYLQNLVDKNKTHQEMVQYFKDLGMSSDVAEGFVLTMKSYFFGMGRMVDDNWLDNPQQRPRPATVTWITQRGYDYLQTIQEEASPVDWKTRQAGNQ